MSTARPHQAGAADIPGATAGELGVSPSGAASYSIPITVPPGTTGVQPNLTLQYSSQAGYGQMGMGWSIGGLSTINRCGTDLHNDGYIDPVDYDSNDKLCLNGQRLVPVSGAYLANGTEYRTTFEEFSKIIERRIDGRTRFEIRKKSGEILEYGKTADSHIEAEGRTDGKARLWALNQIRDRAGNYINFQYHEDTAKGRFRLDRVLYTGNHRLWNNHYVTATGDFNSDGLTDFITCAADDNGRRTSSQDNDRLHTVVRNSATSVTFVRTQIPSATHIPTGYEPVSSGDFNGDGTIDIYLMTTDDELG